MTTFLPLNASCVWILVGAPQAVPSASSGAQGTYMKVALGIWSPLEIAWLREAVANVRDSIGEKADTDRVGAMADRAARDDVEEAKGEKRGAVVSPLVAAESWRAR